MTVAAKPTGQVTPGGAGGVSPGDPTAAGQVTPGARGA